MTLPRLHHTLLPANEQVLAVLSARVTVYRYRVSAYMLCGPYLSRYCTVCSSLDGGMFACKSAPSEPRN